MSDAAAVAEMIKKHDIKTVQIGFVDLQGVLRGKFIPAKYFLETMEKGFAFCVVALGWDIQCQIVNGIEFSSWENGFPDMIAKPDLSTFQKIPWEDGNGFVMCDLVTEEGDPVPFSPRAVLKNVISEMKTEGYSPVMAAELEFYLLENDGRNTPVWNGIQCYNLLKGAEVEKIVCEIREQMGEIGIVIEAGNTEYGPGQVEVNLKYGEALDIADKTAIFKHGVKRIARKHGLVASFMSKIWVEESGNGFHVHQSLWDENGKNVFSNGNHGMTPLMESYIAGLVKNAKELQIFGAWTVNGYKRVRDYSYAPIRANWGTDNRTTSVRAVLGGNGTRAENRAAAAEANPYLVFAANLAAGLDGMRNNVELPKMIKGDGYADGTGELLPSTLGHARDELMASEVAKRYLGQELVDVLATMTEHEILAFYGNVSDWERERYLEMV